MIDWYHIHFSSSGYQPKLLQTFRHQVQGLAAGGRGAVQHLDVLSGMFRVYR
jgi:hypothetical protein